LHSSTFYKHSLSLAIRLLHPICPLILLFYFFFFTTPRPPGSTLFPYTTLFRSGGDRREQIAGPERHAGADPLGRLDPGRAPGADPERAGARVSGAELDPRQAMGRHPRRPDPGGAAAPQAAIRRLPQEARGGREGARRGSQEEDRRARRLSAEAGGGRHHAG